MAELTACNKIDMGPETFTKCESIEQRGDDGLPRHLLQLDVENVETKQHIVHHFVDTGALVLLLQ